MQHDEKFDYRYTAPTEEERLEIERIRSEFLPEKTIDKIDRLRLLDKKVRRLPLVVAIIVGVLGTLVAGAGMAMVLEWNLIAWGVAVGILGIAVFAIAFPLRNLVLKRTKRKYGREILALSGELLNEEEQ